MLIRSKAIALAILLTCALAEPCGAGTTGVLLGHVWDREGRPAANVEVKVASPSAVASTISDARGFFSFLTLPPDVYTIIAGTLGPSGAMGYGFRVASDQTTLVRADLNGPRCGSGYSWGYIRASVWSSDRSQDFSSLDVRQLDRYPQAFAVLPLLPPSQNGNGTCL